MEIDDTFRVEVPVEEAWRVLLDLERIAPCLPGAQLKEIEGDEYRGVVKVKVGPISAQYKGTASSSRSTNGPTPRSSMPLGATRVDKGTRRRRSSSSCSRMGTAPR